MPKPLSFCWVALWLACFGLNHGEAAEQQPLPAKALSLREFICQVLAYNENIQIQLLEFEVSRQGFKGEKGIFEPELVASYDHERNKRQTTLQEQVSLRTSLFEEENNVYNASLEWLLPAGTRVRLGYTLRDLRNNLNPFSFFGNTYNPFLTNHEFASFAGASVVQPLLKNAGVNATLAKIRLGAISSDIAFQEYRRQLMLAISRAEAAYWNLYLAQEQLLFLGESVAVAQTLVDDNKERLKAGKGSELEVLEAQSGLALRQSKQAESRQKYYEALRYLMGLYSQSVITTNQIVLVIDEPELKAAPSPFFESWQYAFDLNPDYLIGRKKLLGENIRLAYAKNQRLPQLDLKGSYGLNGLGDTADNSMDHLTTGGFPSWMVGVEMRIPVGGGIKTRAELNAAKLRQQEALLNLKQLETQLANTLETAIQKITSAASTVGSYQSATNFSQNLLASQIARLNVGKIESRKVLEAEADLFEAKTSLVEAKVQYQRALLEQELMQGSLLKARNLDVTQEQLEERTRELVKAANISQARLRALLHDLQLSYLESAPHTKAEEITR